MALLLVYKRMNGEPLGILAEDGTSYFGTGDDTDKSRAEAIVGYKGTQVPWDVWADQLASGYNHTSLWDTMNSDADLGTAYNTVLNSYEASEGTAVANDN